MGIPLDISYNIQIPNIKQQPKFNEQNYKPKPSRLGHLKIDYWNSPPVAGQVFVIWCLLFVI